MSTKNKPLLIVLNGPMHSGKDAIGSQIKTELELTNITCTLVSFKSELFKDLCTAYKVTMEQALTFHADGVKELPRVEYGGKSSRQALIHVSEDIMKPVYGPQIYGDKLGVEVKSFWPRPDVVVVTDSGFDAEFEALHYHTRLFYDLFVVHLARRGCQYDERDSRNYLKAETMRNLKVPAIWCTNNYTLREAANEILNEATRLCR